MCSMGSRGYTAGHGRPARQAIERPLMPSPRRSPRVDRPGDLVAAEKLPEAVDLGGRYPIRWRPYSTITGDGSGDFRWTAAVIQGSLPLPETRPANGVIGHD